LEKQKNPNTTKPCSGLVSDTVASLRGALKDLNSIPEDECKAWGGLLRRSKKAVTKALIMADRIVDRRAEK